MKYKEYKKLMSVPLKELSTNDQAKRNEEFQRRLNICKVFLTGIKNGYVSTDITNEMEDDDPIRDMVAVIQAQVNELPGEA
jgi:hypothetical protein|tara:strand:- start:57 stop:299 length:243 start_codon:yes stop_codon:yes gene_type:complete